MGEPIIQVENLYKNYGAVEALRGMSFAVEEGEVFGLLGPERRRARRPRSKSSKGCGRRTAAWRAFAA